METPLPIVEEMLEIATNLPPEKRKQLDYITKVWKHRHGTFNRLVSAIVEGEEPEIKLNKQFIEQAAGHIAARTNGEVSELAAKCFLITLFLAVSNNLFIRISNTVWPPGSD